MVAAIALLTVRPMLDAVPDRHHQLCTRGAMRMRSLDEGRARTDDQRMGIPREPVASSVLSSIGYDEASGKLEVEFGSGEVYRYYDVAPLHAEGLRRADSKGRYLNEQIKPRYRYEHVNAR
jgi:hypothetical protein